MSSLQKTAPQVNVSVDGFSADPALLARIEAKAAKLHRHHTPRLGSLQLHIRKEHARAQPSLFKASATIHIGGRETAIHCEADEPDTVVNEVFSRLERAAQERAGERKHARHSAPALEGAGE